MTDHDRDQLDRDLDAIFTAIPIQQRGEALEYAEAWCEVQRRQWAYQLQDRFTALLAQVPFPLRDEA